MSEEPLCACLGVVCPSPRAENGREREREREREVCICGFQKDALSCARYPSRAAPPDTRRRRNMQGHVA